MEPMRFTSSPEPSRYTAYEQAEPSTRVDPSATLLAQPCKPCTNTSTMPQYEVSKDSHCTRLMLCLKYTVVVISTKLGVRNRISRSSRTEIYCRPRKSR